MTDDFKMRARRAVMALRLKSQGESVILRFNADPPDLLEQEVSSFGHKKKCGVRIDRGATGLTLTRDDTVLLGRYAVLDKLDVGETHTFVVPPKEISAVRVSVSQRGIATGRRYTCQKVLTGVLVTRLGDDEERRSGRPRVASSSKNWDMSPLENLFWVDFEPTPHQVSALRHAVSRAQVERGWTLTTRYTGGGRVRVYRLDHPATGPGPAQSPSESTIQDWADRHGINQPLPALRLAFEDAQTTRAD